VKADKLRKMTGTLQSTRICMLEFVFQLDQKPALHVLFDALDSYLQLMY
jgi:hypothetical protein